MRVSSYEQTYERYLEGIALSRISLDRASSDAQQPELNTLLDPVRERLVFSP
jgi:hypothetical protein